MRTTDSPSSRGAGMQRVLLHGMSFDAFTERGCAEYVMGRLETGCGGWIVTSNVDHLRKYQRDPAFRRLVASADVRVADGMPLVWASRVQGTPLPERVAGSNLMPLLCAAAAAWRRSVYLLGGDPGTADLAAALLRDRHPELVVAGTYCPPFGFEKDEACLESIRRKLEASKADIVFVALGAPKQEIFIDRNRHVLPRSWWIGVGISFSFLCGRVKRAPVWMQRCGLEWFHRLLQEPGKLTRRYLLDDAPFAVALLGSSLRRRFRAAQDGANGP